MIKFEAAKYQDKEYRPVNKAQSDEHVARLSDAKYLVSSREDKPTSSKPSAPFITSTLQQAASTRLGYGVKRP